MSNDIDISVLDPRGKWDKLRKFQPDQKSKLIAIPDEDLKVLCYQRCHVLVYHFNVLSKISDAYDKDCQARKEEPNLDTRIQLFKEKGSKIYVKFYKPRLSWFYQQQEFSRWFRQDEFYYKSLIKRIKNRRVEEEMKALNVSQSSSNIQLHDSLHIESSEEFLGNLLSLPAAYQSTQMVGESLDDINDIVKDL